MYLKLFPQFTFPGVSSTMIQITRNNRRARVTKFNVVAMVKQYNELNFVEEMVPENEKETGY